MREAQRARVSLSPSRSIVKSVIQNRFEIVKFGYS